MESHPLYGKRKKKKLKVPNPLFEHWITEWRDEAAEKGIKSQYTYGKALKTLKKCPLKFSTGKECKILDNFGDKICKMLDDKLAEHVETYGTTEPVNLHSDNNKGSIKPSHVKSSTSVNKASSASVEKNAISSRNTAPRTHDISDSSEDETLAPQKPARKRQKSGAREYVPVFRSGPYALIIALYREMQSPESVGDLNRADLVRKAQPLADKSFSLPDPGCRYTAWSSMGTLIKKGLVIKESSPARYSLTDAGCELAHKLESVKDDCGQSCDSSVPFTIYDPVPAKPVVTRIPSMQQNTHQPVIDTNGTTSSNQQPLEKSGLRYWYISEEGKEVRKKDQAIVTVDDDIGVGFLVKCNYTALLKSGLKYKLDLTRPLGNDFVYVYLSNESAENTANFPWDTSTNTTESDRYGARDTTVSGINGDTQKLSPLSVEPKFCLPSDIVTIDSEESSRDSLPCIPASENIHKAKHKKDTGYNVLTSNPVKSNLEQMSLFDRLSSKIELPRTFSAESQESCSQQSQNSIKSISSVSSGSSVQNLPPPDFVLRPGEFDILLCVDNAEYYGASKGNSKTLLPDLIKNGIDCDLRKLHVGDILWVAKERVKPLPGCLERPQGRELVLNYIIERKRMDDLVGSCIDGRFKEQKFRLKKCGLHFPMYLIEDHGSMQHFSLPESTIRQTITNTQVIDGFKVKRTKDGKESVAFLTVFTRYLQSHFKDKTLYACGLDAIKDSNVMTTVNDDQQYLATFEEFNQGSVKSKALTVHEMFGKQLIQLHGMSAEKARAVIDSYPTPSHLLGAYANCSTEKFKENLLASIKCGKSMRSLGQAQSKQIYQLYNTNSALK